VPSAISNTSPLLYLHRLGTLDWLRSLFAEVWVPQAVVNELDEGRRRGFDVPTVSDLAWCTVMKSNTTPSEWLSLDLGPGELGALALALENPERVVLLDDSLARRTATAAGLRAMGTLGILLEVKKLGLIPKIEPYVDRLAVAGMWLSPEIKRRVLALAREP
jgi:hypothetical protein